MARGDSGLRSVRWLHLQGGFPSGWSKHRSQFHGSRAKLLAPVRGLLAWSLDPQSVPIATIEQDLGPIEQSAQGLPNAAPWAFTFGAPGARSWQMLLDLHERAFASYG